MFTDGNCPSFSNSRFLLQFAVSKIFFIKIESDLHWSSVKEFFCLKAIDIALEASLKFWPINMKLIPGPS